MYKIKFSKVSFVSETFEIDYEHGVVNTPGLIVEAMRKIWEPDLTLRERIYIVALNKKLEITKTMLMSVGGTKNALLDVNLTSRFLIMSNAVYFAMVHNHPSGGLKESECDIKLTRNLKQIGKLLEIQMLDSIIITETSYKSFFDEI